MGEYVCMQGLIRFSAFRNWRVVEAADSEGVRRQCLLLPMEMNGIFLSNTKNLPFMRLHIIRTKQGSTSKYAYSMTPFIPTVIHEKMIAEGLASPNDRAYANVVGGIRYAKK